MSYIVIQSLQYTISWELGNLFSHTCRIGKISPLIFVNQRNLQIVTSSWFFLYLILKRVRSVYVAQFSYNLISEISTLCVACEYNRLSSLLAGFASQATLFTLNIPTKWFFWTYLKGRRRFAGRRTGAIWVGILIYIHLYEDRFRAELIEGDSINSVLSGKIHTLYTSSGALKNQQKRGKAVQPLPLSGPVWRV